MQKLGEETVKNKAAAACSCSALCRNDFGCTGREYRRKDSDDMRFGGQGTYKKGRKEAPGARSVEELGWITSKLA
jgi:hypothetical protein